jgi:hypothetical protein
MLDAGRLQAPAEPSTLFSIITINYRPECRLVGGWPSGRVAIVLVWPAWGRLAGPSGARVPAPRPGPFSATSAPSVLDYAVVIVAGESPAALRVEAVGQVHDRRRSRECGRRILTVRVHVCVRVMEGSGGRRQPMARFACVNRGGAGCGKLVSASERALFCFGVHAPAGPSRGADCVLGPQSHSHLAGTRRVRPGRPAGEWPAGPPLGEAGGRLRPPKRQQIDCKQMSPAERAHSRARSSK